MDTYTPKPGDYFLCQIEGALGLGIRMAQALSGDASRYTHAGVVLDDGTVLQAEPGGASIVPLADIIGKRPLAFSDYDLSNDQRIELVAAARAYEGVPYNFLDYLSLGLLALRIKPKRLRARIHGSGHLICSQLVDKVYSSCGIRLFDDGRDSGDVTPGDLAHVGTIFHAYTGPYTS